MKNDSEANEKYPEGNEYQNKNSKNVVPNSLKFTAIMFLILGLLLPFITYFIYNDLVNYENGGNIRLNEIIWLFYDIGGKEYGKIIVVTVLFLAFVMCAFQAFKYWKVYKEIKNEFKK